MSDENAIADVVERLEKADRELFKLYQSAGATEFIRLAGKREGVQLALSYLRETQP
ncbi:hypothetical protein PROPHIGD91-2_14 [Mycobacterium phage prophiGD91-2]|uniref:hypothetical protein n=1 Tax=Mycobacteroides abscessus TaxID=36809 RepID=UPI000929CE6C|nr:hypothetical protein [Mycobacteroides abscessus]QSM03871.1 hypothetical protein PROPHIGD91-2_14 [Mycobacterium phage prophiGD91-2]QSM90493.1 hypothetical protein I3U44_07425 [Mycobacteroides abscessus subsp. bolletii]QSM90779.1 hypothetical protein I3U44_09070 [Mycobacteroides abscessus subsp. bolletii]SIJ02529.1 Uncharacterised protein [Mycobacteroides abscessus subsp. bolletii]SLD37620.1 Uncharacterised protein [Mycobacteroides abscessus subsp. bolletii]